MHYITLLAEPLLETLQMVMLSTVIALVLGLPLGILLVLWDVDGLKSKKGFYQVINIIVNTTRSIPFIILMILLFPLSRMIVGTTIGTMATVVPLSIAATPFMARIIESAIKEVDQGIIEAIRAMGGHTNQIIFKVLIPEALPSLVRGITMLMISLVGYSAMAGAIGGGGLGDLAIRYGYHRYQMDVLIAAVIIIIIIVQVIQGLGNYISQKILNRR